MKTSFNPFESLQVHPSSFASDEPQAYEISVHTPDDWQYVHDILMQDGTLEDNIPSRSCDCVSDMCCSPTRSVYLLSDDEVAQLINHEKINWIRKSPLFNQDVVEQRKLTQEVLPDTFTNRYKFNIESVRNDSDTTLSSLSLIHI